MASTDDTDSVRSQRELDLERDHQQWLKEHKRIKDIPPQDGRAYLKHAKNLLPILEAFSELHPIAKAVVSGFKAVVLYEDDRKENDARVDVVFLAQGDMLRTILDIHKLSARQKSRWERDGGDDLYAYEDLSELLFRVEKEIKACGNSMDTYHGEKRLVKFWKSQDWKRRIMGHVDQFNQYRILLEQTLSIQVASDVINLVDKMDILLTRLFSPKADWEKDVAMKTRQLSKSKDAREIINDPESLQTLIDATKDPLLDSRSIRDDRSSKSRASLPSEVSPIEQLKRELNLSLDSLCEKNKQMFELKLNFHTQQLQAAIMDSAQYVIDSLSGPYDRLHDEDLKVLWKEMNWIFCVDNKLFTSALFEYYLDHFSSSRNKSKEGVKKSSEVHDEMHGDEGGGHEVEDNLDKVTALSQLGVLNHPDSWTLALIAKYGGRISLSIDRDDSGFIRISEANTFTGRMPDGWNLPQWCAYAAVGWSYEARVYRKRIQKLIDRMFEMQATVLPANRGFVTLSIVNDIVPFYQLLAFEPVYDGDEVADPPAELRLLVHNKIKLEDEEWRNKLKSLNWTVEDETTLQMLYGKEAFETYVLQLGVLLLEYTYQVMQACERVTIDVKEISHLMAPLHLLRRLCLSRINSLRAEFAKESTNKNSLENFHGGIWELLGRAVTFSNDEVSFADPASLRFGPPDIYDFTFDEEVLDEFPLDPLPEGYLPYLQYTTWEEHVETLAEEDIPETIPDTWQRENEEIPDEAEKEELRTN